MMKMVVGYVPGEAFEAIREELLGLGIVSLSVSQSSGTAAEATSVIHYRGSDMENHSRPKARLECVIGSEHTKLVTDSILKHAPEQSFVFVVPVEFAHPTGTVLLDEAETALAQDA